MTRSKPNSDSEGSANFPKDTTKVFTPPVPEVVRVNPIRSIDDWQAMRDVAEKDSGTFHGDIAARMIHWFHPELGAWLTKREDGSWYGWRTKDAAEVFLDEWIPWETGLDESHAPHYRWFVGGRTNAAFNEVDRHVLAGHGSETAFYFEGDRWDASANQGRGGPVRQGALSRRELFIQSVLAAQALRDLDLDCGDRIALNMPNILDQIIWTEAAKRLGVIYTPVFGGFSDKTLSDRIEDAGAKVVITADGASRNAETVPFKEIYTDPAIDRFIPLPDGLDIIRQVSGGKFSASIVDEIAKRVEKDLVGEITVLPADIMRSVGAVLDQNNTLELSQAAEFRADLAETLAASPRKVEKVVVVRHAGLSEVPWTDERDVWAHDLMKAAEANVCEEAGVKDIEALRTLDDQALTLALWKSEPCEPLDANFPLFIIYTSGSTGKPKGVVHTHGGYVAGITFTMRISFDAVPGKDVMYVIADPGWITGQSYLITGSLSARISGIVTEGAPVFPDAGRFASIIERYGVTIFKAGVTFLKTIMSNPQNQADVERFDMSSLKVATFCAEPTSPTVQKFGMDLVTPQYINSYWATEHGGIVWTHFYGNADQPLRADARTYPLPWVFGDVWVAEGDPDQSGRFSYRPAEPEEQGEIVITRPYPYLARTIWGNGDQVLDPDWTGDIDRYTSIYFGRYRDGLGNPVWSYLQGDFARRYEDGSFSLHGRSDDVINVSGHRMGTEEIEGAILKDRQFNPNSPVGNCIVIGAPHRDKGLTPVAFVQTPSGRNLTKDEETRLKALVREEKGSVAVPSDMIAVSAFPETRSGKYMRRLIKNLIEGKPLGDVTTLRNPECLDEIANRIEVWKRGRSREEEQTLFEEMRFIRIQYDPVGINPEGAPVRVATLSISHPPVNSLSERVLDELGTAIGHIDRRDDVGAVVITGTGGKTFVAGADVRQLMEEVTDIDQARAIANKAHVVFSRIESLEKPVIAAIHGVALGGGCELAMACHYRIGNSKTRLGQPEINLFLPPGYGGTQRLTRLLEARLGHIRGTVSALSVMLSGRQISAEEAFSFGLLDYIVQGSEDVLSFALARAREAAVMQTGPATDAMRKRQDLLREWSCRADFSSKEILEDATVNRLMQQAAATGREQAAKAIIDLVAFGREQGFRAGLAKEADTFASLVIDKENGGGKGIPLFFDKASPPLPSRTRPERTDAYIEDLILEGELLPVGSPFYPGVTPIPRWQQCWAVVRDGVSGTYNHGDPREAEVEELIPVPTPGPNQALLYVLASEVNYNDIWAITGIPVSLFDEHDEDIHVTGSGGVALVVGLGEEIQQEGRLTIGDLINVYSGVSDLLDPVAADDPMFTQFHIQGYQSPDGSHQQFMLADGPQCHKLPADLTLEQAASYILPAGTVYRALFNTLGIRSRQRMLVEGAATGTGAWAVSMGLAVRQNVTGIVSSDARARQVEKKGARAVNRKDQGFSGCFRPVPRNPRKWDDWEREGEAFIEAIRGANNGELMDYAISHAGETAFPRSFQALAPGGKITFYGASSGYHMTFMGKPGVAAPEEMLARASMRPGDAVLVFYGIGTAGRDNTALASIEAAREAGGRIVVVTDKDAERNFVLSLGYGDAVLGAVSLEEIKRRIPAFEWPETMPDLPDPQKETSAFKEIVRFFNENTFKPLGTAIGRILRNASNPRGVPDIVIERANRDSLAVSTMLVKPNTGRVVYVTDMSGRRYSFYAPQVWMRQRRIYMPGAEIHGTHLCNAAEVVALNRLIDSGMVSLDVPHLGAWSELPEIHQAMWENRLPEFTDGATNAVVNHALPENGLKTRNELFASWAERQSGNLA